MQHIEMGTAPMFSGIEPDKALVDLQYSIINIAISLTAHGPELVNADYWLNTATQVRAAISVAMKSPDERVIPSTHAATLTAPSGDSGQSLAQPIDLAALDELMAMTGEESGGEESAGGGLGEESSPNGQSAEIYTNATPASNHESLPTHKHPVEGPDVDHMDLVTAAGEERAAAAQSMSSAGDSAPGGDSTPRPGGTDPHSSGAPPPPPASVIPNPAPPQVGAAVPGRSDSAPGPSAHRLSPNGASGVPPADTAVAASRIAPPASASNAPSVSVYQTAAQTGTSRNPSTPAPSASASRLAPPTSISNAPTPAVPQTAVQTVTSRNARAAKSKAASAIAAVGREAYASPSKRPKPSRSSKPSGPLIEYPQSWVKDSTERTRAAAGAQVASRRRKPEPAAGSPTTFPQYSDAVLHHLQQKLDTSVAVEKLALYFHSPPYVVSLCSDLVSVRHLPL